MGTTKLKIETPDDRDLIFETIRDSIHRVNVAFVCPTRTMSINLGAEGIRLVHGFLSEILEDIPAPAALRYNSTEGWSFEPMENDMVHGYWSDEQEARAALKRSGYYVQGEPNDGDQ